MLVQVVCAGLVWRAGGWRESAVLGRHDPPLSVECSWDDRRATVVVRGEVDFATVGILAKTSEDQELARGILESWMQGRSR